jgi:hypothetical protein
VSWLGRRRRGPAPDESLTPVKNSVLLRPLRVLVALLSGPAAALGADATQFRAIVEAKLRIDLRQGGIKNPNRPGRGGLALTCLGYALAGTVIGFLAFLEPHAFTYMALTQAIAMVLLAMALITDFLSLIMDPADLGVIAPRPVSDRMMGSLVLGPTVVGSIVFGPLAWIPSMLLITPLAGLFTLMMILSVFLAVMRLVGSERVRTFMLAAQMTLSLGVFVAWQLLAFAVRDSATLDWFRTEDALKALIPPYWFGGFAALAVEGPTPLRAVLAGMALGLPVLVTVTVLRLASTQRLSAMAAMAGSEPDARGSTGPGIFRRLGRVLTLPGPERAGFDMFLSVARHDRLFRMRVYPMLVIPLVFILIFTVTGGQAGERIPLAVAAAFLPAIYSFIILVQTRYSESPKAAWIFSTAPVEQLGLFASGVVRALCLCFLLPWLLLVLGLTAILTGKGQILDAVFASLAVVTATFLLAGLLTRRTLPFSQEMSSIDGASNILALVIGSSLMGLLFGLYLVLQQAQALLAVATAVLVPLCAIVARRLRRMQVPYPTSDGD